MTVQERLRLLLEALPEGSSVTLPRGELKRLLDEDSLEASAAPRAVVRDLTVEEVAEKMGRAPSTIRGWLLARELEGYKLNRRDWRIPPDALRRYRERQGAREPRFDDDEPVDIQAWRRVKEGGP